MPWHLRTPTTLTDRERSTWHAYQRENTLLDSPYFRPEWCDALAAVGRPIEIAVHCAADSEEPLAFLAFERDGHHAYPTGRRINDYQALICRDNDIHVDAGELLNATNLSSIAFDHLVSDQAAFCEFHEQQDSSPYIDLAEGREAYAAGLSKSGRSDASTARRKGRKLAREVGDVQLNWSSLDDADLDRLFDWKSKQYHETGVPDVFASDWTRQLLSNLREHASADFAGVLSTLTAGNEVVAVHFGIRCHGVLHWWFPSYDDDFGKYSPGRVMLQQMIDGGPEAGITKIDLGKGMSSYKERTMSAATPLAVGIVENAPVRRFVRQSATSAKGWLKQTPLRRPLSVPAGWLHRLVSERAMQ